jgi:hypothetical protein
MRIQLRPAPAISAKSCSVCAGGSFVCPLYEDATHDEGAVVSLHDAFLLVGTDGVKVLRR